MNAASRFGNRAALTVLGLVGLAVAVVAAWPLTGGAPWALADGIRNTAASAGLAPVVAAWIVAAVLAIVVLLALVWVARRGRGRTRHAVEQLGLHITTGVVEDLVRDALRGAPDIVGVHASTHRRRGERVLLLRLQLRPRADVVQAAADVRAALADLDRAMGEALPVVAHLTTGVRTVLAHDRRVD